jgi:3-phenylpropionate/cinnamic acid dioxygenase small subunit
VNDGLVPRSSLREALLDLPLHEAALLDERRYAEWLALFAPEGLYWVPLDQAQATPADGQSLAAEDVLLLTIRIERLRDAAAPSLQPPARGLHVLQAPRLLAGDPNDDVYATRAPFVYAEAHGDEQIVLAGTVTHTTRLIDGALRIVQKRVDLLNAGAPLPAIHLLP